MVVIDEATGNEIRDPDLSLGYVFEVPSLIPGAEESLVGAKEYYEAGDFTTTLYYRRYTEEQRVARDNDIQRTDWLDNGRSDTDAAITELYEMILEMGGTGETV